MDVSHGQVLDACKKARGGRPGGRHMKRVDAGRRPGGGRHRGLAGGARMLELVWATSALGGWRQLAACWAGRRLPFCLWGQFGWVSAHTRSLETSREYSIMLPGAAHMANMPVAPPTSGSESGGTCGGRWPGQTVAGSQRFLHPAPRPFPATWAGSRQVWLARQVPVWRPWRGVPPGAGTLPPAPRLTWFAPSSIAVHLCPWAPSAMQHRRSAARRQGFELGCMMALVMGLEDGGGRPRPQTQHLA